MKKLSISKETLRKLDDGTLENVAGGMYGPPNSHNRKCFESAWPDKPC